MNTPRALITTLLACGVAGFGSSATLKTVEVKRERDRYEVVADTHLDAPATAIRTVEGRPNYRAVNIWRTEAAPAPINAPDSIQARARAESPPGLT